MQDIQKFVDVYRIDLDEVGSLERCERLQALSAKHAVDVQESRTAELASGATASREVREHECIFFALIPSWSNGQGIQQISKKYI